MNAYRFSVNIHISRLENQYDPTWRGAAIFQTGNLALQHALQLQIGMTEAIATLPLGDAPSTVPVSWLMNPAQIMEHVLIVGLSNMQEGVEIERDAITLRLSTKSASRTRAIRRNIEAHALMRSTNILPSLILSSYYDDKWRIFAYACFTFI